MDTCVICHSNLENDVGLFLKAINPGMKIKQQVSDPFLAIFLQYTICTFPTFI